jgi:predicted MPP superfamily phosphohydrolase
MSSDTTRSRLLTRRRFLGGGAVAAGLFATHVTVFERLRLELNHYRVPVRDLPRSLEGTRVLQVSDIHHGPLMGRGVVEKVLERAAAVPCEAVALTGDYVHGDDSRRSLEWVLPQLGRLRAPLGVHAVLGNHDHYADAARAKEMLGNLGISLVHAKHAIERDDGRLWIAGTGDLWEDRLSIDPVLRDVPAREPRIVLAHNPDTADRDWKARVDLMLSGHTHGGQIDLPLVGPPVLPVENKRYARGLIDTPRTRLFVSKGIGWTVAPVRFRCAPELALLELVRDESRAAG